VVEEKGMTTRQKLVATSAVVFILGCVIVLDGLLNSIGNVDSGDRRVCDSLGVKSGVSASIGNIMAWMSGILYFWSRFGHSLLYSCIESLRSMKITRAKVSRA
jgi:hypothetical protein